jgi:hypothetical protein
MTPTPEKSSGRLNYYFKFFEIIMIPLSIAVGGWFLENIISERGQQQEYLKVAVSILTAEAETHPALRNWAVDLLTEYSPKKIDEQTIKGLKSGEIKLPAPVQNSPVFDSQTSIAPRFPQKIEGSDYSNSNFIEPQLHNKKIYNSKFNDALFLRGRFYNSTIDSTTFKNAKLQSADFRWVEFKNVDFSGSDLSGADFFGVTGIDTIKWSETTVCPDGARAGNTGCSKHFIKYPWNK